jgi:acyl carrier protein
MNDFINNFKEILDEPEDANLSPESIFKDLDEWDSLTNLSLMAMVDSDYNVKLNADEVTNSDTLLDLFNLIKSKQ